MPIPSADKAKGKRQILRIVEPTILQLGFIKHRNFGYICSLVDNTEWRLLIDVPTHNCVYRISPSIILANGTPILGPTSSQYAAPNSPNGIRYDFGFHIAVETHNRCAANIIQWLNDVAMPWFRSHPTSTWVNLYVIR